MSTDKQPTQTPEEQSAALATKHVDKVLAQYVSDPDDTGAYELTLGENDTFALRQDLIDAIATAYRAQAAEVERLRHENALLVDHGPQATIAELQAQLAREKARAEEVVSDLRAEIEQQREAAFAWEEKFHAASANSERIEQQAAQLTSGQTAGKTELLMRVPSLLHPDTKSLVMRFAEAIANKLRAAEKKYGYSDEWTCDDWMDECRQHLREHLEKGDPRDVAIYCAFLWHHGESTAAQQRGKEGEQ